MQLIMGTREPELTITNACQSTSPRRLLIIGAFRKSLAYRKLPQDPLTLFVIKLDGSSFEVNVPKTATVAELKEAVKCVFNQSPDDEMISWAHVWGHFCLCYNGQKLLDYKAYIRLFGIKDGDKLFFVRHLSLFKFGREKRLIKDGMALQLMNS